MKTYLYIFSSQVIPMNIYTRKSVLFALEAGLRIVYAYRDGSFQANSLSGYSTKIYV